MVKTFSLLKFQAWKEICLVMQRLKYVPVKFHIERTVVYEFILLPGGVTLWSTGTLPYNRRLVRTPQQFEVHHWSGAGREKWHFSPQTGQNTNLLHLRQINYRLILCWCVISQKQHLNWSHFQCLGQNQGHTLAQDHWQCLSRISLKILRVSFHVS